MNCPECGGIRLNYRKRTKIYVCLDCGCVWSPNVSIKGCEQGKLDTQQILEGGVKA